MSKEPRWGKKRRRQKKRVDEKRGFNLVEVARALHLAPLICNQTLSLSSFPTMSPDSVDGSWDKASILCCPRPLLVLFQASALRHRPFCMHPKTAARERTGGRSKYWEGKGGEVRGGVEKVGGGFVDGQTAFSIPSPPSPPTLLLLLLSLLGWYPGPFASNMLQCSATPHLTPWKDSRLHRSHCSDQENWSWPFPLHHLELLRHSEKNIILLFKKFSKLPLSSVTTAACATNTENTNVHIYINLIWQWICIRPSPDFRPWRHWATINTVSTTLLLCHSNLTPIHQNYTFEFHTVQILKIG